MTAETLRRTAAICAGLCVALCAAWLAPAGAAAAAAAGQWDLDQLMQSLAKVRIGRATFIEKKYIAMLDRPVESSGELYYSAPDKFEKRTIKPRPETMMLDGDTLVIERGRQSHTMQLSGTPELAGFIDSIRGTLAGDRKALERSFKLKLDGTAERWSLALTPLDARMASAIKVVRIAGAGDNVHSVEIVQADGDRSVMTIERTGVR